MRSMILMWLMLLVPVVGCQAESPNGSELVEHDDQTRETRVVNELMVPDPDSSTLRLYESVMNYAQERELHQLPIGEIMQEVGLFFRGKPYIAGMLDVPDEETLICRLDGFDCVTFVETTLAMARGISNQDYRYDSFARHVMDQRYRDGEMDGYCSRLHYFSDWIADNERRGNVVNITEEIGGVSLEKEINFMSEHRESYPRLADDEMFQCILEAENQLLNLDFFFIPQEQIRSTYDLLQPGDIVATVARIEGLDVTHTGLVYDDGSGRKGLLHASTSGGVKVSPDLQSYIQGNKGQIGVIISRPQNP